MSLRLLPSLVGLGFAIAAISCADSPTTRTITEPHSGSVFAKNQVDTNPRANLVWADFLLVDGVQTPAGIRGDGRLKNGAVSAGTPSNEYQGAWCGTSAFRLGADLDFKPNSGWTRSMQSACGSERLYRFYLNGPTGTPVAVGSHSIARGLWSLAIGQSAAQWEGFGVQLPGCDLLMFNDTWYYLPFSLTVTEVRYPWSSYP